MKNLFIILFLIFSIIACTNKKFIPVEKQPVVDIAKLSKLIVYPDIPRRSGIEGRVVVKVLVDKTGKILKSKIEHSDHILLNSAALNAINAYGDFEPAEQGGKKVACWLTVPITFRLRDNEVKENE